MDDLISEFNKKCLINIPKTVYIIIIQKICRGYLIRKQYRKLKDSMSIENLHNLIINYNIYKKSIEDVNKKLVKKKIRLPNFESAISENIAKFAFYKKYNYLPSWDTDVGDLTTNKLKLEVKGSIDLMNGGPSSFGPTESWDRIYFVDAIDTYNKNYKVYEIRLSNTSKIWKNIKVNKIDTYRKQCNEKRRPRIPFKNIIKQIPSDKVELIFNGNINDLY